MKKTLVIAGLAVLSTNAFASKARMEALGQGFQSLYIQDTRSVFINPAAVNDNKNYIVTEWGTSGTTDADTAPRAEGGFFREMGTFSYGLYLGNDDSTVASGHNFLTQSNALDLFVGGDMGMKWGAKLHYSASKDEQGAFAKKHDALGVGMGVIHGDMEGYVNLDLSDKATGSTVVGDESKQKLSMQVGGSYKMAGWSLLADYSSAEREENDNGGAKTTKKSSNIYVGAGRIHEMAAGSRLITDVGFQSNVAEDSSGAGTKTTTTNVPVTLGMEVDSTSWLTLRGSVGQNIIGSAKNKDGKVATIANSTAINAGATLNFGKLKVDGVIGNSTTGSTTVGAVTTNTTSKVGVLSSNSLMSRVGVTYSF